MGGKHFVGYKDFNFGQWFRITATGDKVGERMSKREAQRRAKIDGKPLFNHAGERLKTASYVQSDLEHEIGALSAENAALGDASTQLHQQLLNAEERCTELEAKIGRLVEENKKLTVGIIGATEERESLRDSWKRECQRTEEANADRKRYEGERDAALVEMENARLVINGLKRSLHEARIHAEVMRQQAYPVHPRFPWE